MIEQAFPDAVAKAPAGDFKLFSHTQNGIYFSFVGFLKSSFPKTASKKEIITMESVVAETEDIQSSTNFNPKPVDAVSKIR